MTTVHMVDQAARHATAPNSNEAKRLRAKNYLQLRGITLQIGGFAYLPAASGSAVLRQLRRRAK